VFGRFAIGSADTMWTFDTAAGGGKRVTELIVSNR
jgi:hypothetical protein